MDFGLVMVQINMINLKATKPNTRFKVFKFNQSEMVLVDNFKINCNFRNFINFNSFWYIGVNNY